MGDIVEQTAISTLAKWAADLTFDDIPETVIETSKHLILDTIGVTVAATADPIAKSVRAWVDDFGPAGGSSVVGIAAKVSALSAAHANATLAHALDFDDHGYGGHASACVVPAVLAAAQSDAVDGRDILTAYVAGMEAFGRLAICVPVPTIAEYGFHPTGVLGMVASTVAAGKVAGLSADLLAEAITIGSSRGTGHTASFGTTVKPLHAGHAAAGGIQAVQLAKSGFTGNKRLFEDPEGFGEAYTRGAADWPKFLEAMEGPFRLSERQPSIKQWPCCGGNQRSIQNLARIMAENSLADADVARVEVHVNPRQLTALRYDWPTNAYEAKFCLPFTVSTTLAKGSPGLVAFRDEYWNDKEVLAARERVELIADGVGDKHQVTISVFTHSGKQFDKSEWIVRGSAGDPMNVDEVSAKFLDCCSFASVPLEVAHEVRNSTLLLDNDGAAFWRAWEALTAI